MRNAIRLIGLFSLVVASVSCGDVVRQGSSPMFLVIKTLGGIRGGGTDTTASNPLLSDVITNVTTPAPCSADSPCPTVFGDAGEVVLLAPLKNVGATSTLSPTTNNQVTINRIHVGYSRADGRNTAGVDVPFPFDTAVTGTILEGSDLTLGFELVRNVAKQEAPLVQLKTSSNIMSVIATLTIYGVDRVGNNIQTTGSIQIEFGNFGDK